MGSRSTALRVWLFTLAVVGCAHAFGPRTARADDDLRLFAEPFSFTDVADAADGEDPFDLNIHVAFRRTTTTATLSREAGVGSARAAANYVTIGDWTHNTSELELGLDIGLFHDVMLFARLPLLLSDTRKVLYPGSPSMAAVDARLNTSVPGEGDIPLLTLPFESPTRSGITTISAGLAFSVMNQARRRELPTWTMLFEGRFAIGDVLNPCASGDDSCNPGSSQGTHAVRFETRLSRRYRFAEVFSGLGYEFAWAGNADDQFSPSGHLSGYRNRRPPMRGTLTAGTAFIPWENRASWQRFAIDLRARATYVSEGRDYSALFDALGASANPYLTTPNLEGVPNGTTVLREVPFNGLTDVQDHGEFGGTVAVELQAARYVRFRLGVDLDYITPHLLTVTDACNPGVSVPDGDARAVGCDEGIINPHHRTILDTPGSRFRQDGALRYRLFIEAAAQF